LGTLNTLHEVLMEIPTILDEGIGLVATNAGAVAEGARFTNGRNFLGQPRGLFFIGCTEFWERISFHGIWRFSSFTWSTSCYLAISKISWDSEDSGRSSKQ
jgi:hypothetical protein